MTAALRPLTCIRNIHRISFGVRQNRCFHKTTGKSQGYKDEPIKFSTSNAARTSLKDKFKAPDDGDRPKHEPYCIALSLSAILIYFCILREENDLDEAFS